MSTTSTDSTPQWNSPLEGIQVIELGRIIAGPFVSQILSDLGASVIKVERAGEGDSSRNYGRVPVDGGSVGAMFATINRGKRSIALDLTDPSDQSVLAGFVERSDVVVHNYLSRTAAKLGFSYDDVRRVNPSVIYCAISGFGPKGPKRDMVANDLIMQAYSGLMSYTGEPGGGPVRCPVSIADYTAGFYATIAILGALFRRTQTGEGARIDTSLLEGMLTLVNHQLLTTKVTGQNPRRMGSSNTLGQPNEAFKTLDGWIVMSAINDSMWSRCARALGGEEFASDPQFVRLADRYAHRDELHDAVQARIAELTSDECLARFKTVAVTAAPILDVDQILSDDQVAALEIFQPAHVGQGEISIVGSPITIDGVRLCSDGRIPGLDADHADLTAESLGA